MKKSLIYSHALRVLLAVALVLLLPLDRYYDWSSTVSELFSFKGWNTKEVATRIATLSEKNEILGLDFSPDGKHLAAAPFDAATVHIWNWQENRLERTLERQKGTNVTVTTPVRYSPDGKLLAICHTPTQTSSIITRVWNTDSWNVAHDIIDPSSGGCESMGFSSDGKSLIRVMAYSAFGFTGDNLAVYDTSTWQPTWGLNTDPFSPSALTISPDNKFVAIGGSVIKGGFNMLKPIQTEFSVIEMERKKLIKIIQPQRSNIVEYPQVEWSPNGERIAYAGRYGVEIYDTRSWKRVSEEPSEGKGVKIHIRYTPDGKYFIESGFGRDGAMVRVWDGEHQQLLQEIKATPESIAVSRNSRYLAMGVHKKIIIWQLK